MSGKQIHLVFRGRDLTVEFERRVVRGAKLELTWESALACWPGDPLGGSFEERRDSELGRVLVTRLGEPKGCRACGKGPLVQREQLDTVHPVSGDGYGVMQERCLSCGAFREWPFSDN